ncbi:double-strand break repair protein AddB [Alteriqipengyuania lutimaris]|uniref:Double-strand break repair protein AddB n=1 Tax=Alteriqipengyuania lutimaris TaxID=1538146 RepID=A0A395LM93_9SPHN|nr:double-strand break repair protein AddB [Alteriqipengyuania lutimaris]MBB3033109.1 ATP-dependent helicase/nuclease subunit B [Alteriqipengyuania lutimaris]RDS77829.1 double-strand break repair protein AddB [Alteriqipengyuania lutimaris]
MSERGKPQVYSIAAHRGFADALVAGLVPRYGEEGLGLARLTLLLPSGRAIRTVSEAFVRHMGESDTRGLLLPRMVTIGDLSLDEALGPLLDPLGASDIPPAVDPTFRWLRLAALLADEMGDDAPSGPPLFRQAQMLAQTMDRLLVEEIAPEELLGDPVLDVVGSVAGHWQNSLRRFARVQARWLVELAEMGRVDAATRRNLLFAHAVKSWRADAPATPIVAAGVTSAAPALARLLRVVSELPQGAVILPDLDLALSDAAWAELGRAGQSDDAQGETLGRDDAPTHPQYHLKLLLNRMGVNRGEVQQWHRRGMGAANPDRTRAVSALFLPPEASKVWVDLPSEKRRLAGVRLLETGNAEEEAQAVALAVREALETAGRRVAVVTPDRALARRIVHHLRRWDIQADDSAGMPLGETSAGRALLLLAQVIAEDAAPVPLVALLGHPAMGVVDSADGAQDEGPARADWLDALRRFEARLRGPRPAAGLRPLRPIAEKADVSQWWDSVATRLALLFEVEGEAPLADLLTRLAQVLEDFCGEGIWGREDGRALGSFVDDLRQQALAARTMLDPQDLHGLLTDAMERIAVRPAYGGHPRVAVYGLLESRMARADLVICAGLNEGTWPRGASPDPLLAPPVLRALGVPGGEFRIGLAAHDLAGALGAPQVLLTRAERTAEGPAIPSRFFLRIKALLGDLASRHEETALPALVDALRDAEPAQPYPQPQPSPPASLRRVRISATALDRLRSDPYQFYARSILHLGEMDPLDAEPSPAWQGTLAHAILEEWHKQGGALTDLAEKHLAAMDAHPLTRALWEPRLMAALEWIANEVASDPQRQIVGVEEKGARTFGGIEIGGTADRIDRLADGSYAIVDYKTGGPPSKKMVQEGFALQLGTLGLLLAEGAYADRGIEGTPTRFEYWSLARDAKSDTGFGYVTTPLKVGAARSGIEPDDFLPETRRFLSDALDRWILGDEAFTARPNPDLKLYATYDQLMRLEEWLGRESQGGEEG